MADRTSAKIFGMIFEMLSNNPTKEHKEMAKEVYYRIVGTYDFSDYQMFADGACLALGIAKRGIRPEYPLDGKVTLWPGEDGYDEAKSEGNS